MQHDPEQAKKAIQKDIKNYRALRSINNSDEFKKFFDLQTNTAAEKMYQVFTGNGPKDWDDFCKMRGEIIGMLYPIQEIRGADGIIKHLTEQLNTYYTPQQ